MTTTTTGKYENMVEQSDIKLNLEMTEKEYLTSMLKDLDHRAKELGLTIKMSTYSEYTNKQLGSGVFEDVNFTELYSKYISKCANLVYFLEKNKKDIDNGVLDFKNL